MKINKNILIVSVVFVLGFVGFVVFNQLSNSKKSNPSSIVKLEKQLNEKKTQEKKLSPNINIKEALNAGIVCEVDQANNRSTFYFKGDKIKMALDQDRSKTYGLILEKKDLYYWEEGSMEGFKVSYQMKQNDKKIEGTTSFFPGMNFNFSMDAVESTNDLNDFEKKIDGRCQVKNIADSEFELPKGVSFSDFSGLKGN